MEWRRAEVYVHENAVNLKASFCNVMDAYMHDDFDGCISIMQLWHLGQGRLSACTERTFIYNIIPAFHTMQNLLKVHFLQLFKLQRTLIKKKKNLN